MQNYRYNNTTALVTLVVNFCSKMFTVKKTRLQRPRSALSSANIKNALRSYLVPPILKYCQCVALRCMFDFSRREEIVQQIAARRRQLEVHLMEDQPNVSNFVVEISLQFHNRGGDNLYENRTIKLYKRTICRTSQL